MRREQAREIPIDREHDHRWVGEVVHLELTGDRLWAVGHVRDDVSPITYVHVGEELVGVETPLYFSASRIGNSPDLEEILIESVSLTTNPARVAATPVEFRRGQLCDRKGWRLDRVQRELLTRAYETNVRRRYADPIRVERDDQPLIERAITGTP